jgi:hypothetical protein
MNESGDLDRDVVIAVLEKHGVEVRGQQEGPADMLVLSKGDRIEGQRLSEVVSIKMIRYLARTYGIPLKAFYDLKTGSSNAPI